MRCKMNEYYEENTMSKKLVIENDKKKKLKRYQRKIRRALKRNEEIEMKKTSG